MKHIIKKRKMKRWLDSEVVSVLEYIIQDGAFEKPTARMFYTKLVEETGVNANWDLLRFKIRHLRTVFQKALDYMKAEGNCSMEDGVPSAVREKVLRICPHFDLLMKIFGDGNDTETCDPCEAFHFQLCENSNSQCYCSENEYLKLSPPSSSPPDPPIASAPPSPIISAPPSQNEYLALYTTSSPPSAYTKQVKKNGRNKQYNPQKHIIRRRPMKKWLDIELVSILQYIIKRGTFEKPTARLFYTELLKETGLNATWDLVRWKVRYLRMVFQKALDYLKAEGICSLGDDTSAAVREKVLRICPHFDLLMKIFGEQNGTEAYNYCQTSDFTLCENSNSQFDCSENDYLKLSPPSSIRSAPSIASAPPSQIASPPPSPNEPPARSRSPPRIFARKVKKNVQNATLQILSTLQKQKMHYNREKLEIERRKLEMENRKLDIEERKLKLQEEKQWQYFQIRKLELEKEERIAQYEVDLRFVMK